MPILQRLVAKFWQDTSLHFVIIRYIIGRMESDLINRLNHYRLEKKLTQEQLAKKLGVTFQTVNRWLNGHMKPRALQKYQIKRLMGLK